VKIVPEYWSRDLSGVYQSKDEGSPQRSKQGKGIAESTVERKF
jgi:hypothetical protein